MNISEALGWMKTLKARHSELVHLRDANSGRTIQRYGNADPVITEPKYDAIKLDRRVGLIAREIRLLDEAIKRTNAAVEVNGFQRNDDGLGEVEA